MDTCRLPAVLDDGDQMVALGEAECFKSAGDAPDAVGPVAVGQPDVAVDDGKRVRLAFDGRNEAPAQIVHSTLLP